MKLAAISALLAGRAEEVCRQLLPNGKKVGNLWKVGDVSGAKGDSLGVQLDGPKRGMWFDHATGQGGDLLKLAELNLNLGTPIAAADWGRQWLGLPAWKPHEDGPVQPAFDPLKKGWRRNGEGEWQYPAKAWPYRDEKGVIFAYACRFNFPDGKKDVIPLRPGDDGKWHWKGWKKGEKRPLYGLDVFATQNDGRPALIVEGEKTADAGRAQFRDVAVFSWQGGCSAVSSIDWTRFREWRGPVVLWPDNDKPGFDAMLYVKAILPKARFVTIPKELPEGWDIADPIPAECPINPRGLLDAAIAPPPPPEEKSKPYVALGTDEKGYYFLNRREGYVLHFQASSLSELNIYRIARDEHWVELGFLQPKSAKVDWVAVAKYLIDECQAAGSFDARFLRGRGVFIDRGCVVFHAGDRLFVDGVEMQQVDFKSDNLYPKRPSVRTVNMRDPLPTAEAARLLELMGLCTWSHPRSAILVAGFLFICVLSGSLPWRPHVGIIGESTAGKSWILTHIIRPLLGDLARILLGSATTEAGVRQGIGIDSITPIFDEFDSESDSARDNQGRIRVLCRQSSSETGGEALKGTMEGHARTYNLRSCFMFLGTALDLDMKSDRSRITLFELAKNQISSDHFRRIEELAAATTEKPEWCARFIGRTIRLAKPAVASVSVFTRVVTRILKDSRAGDQFGTLLGGAWMLENDVSPTEAQATAVAQGIDWGDLMPDSTETDHHQCLSAMLGFRVDYDDGGRRKNTPVGELLRTFFAEMAPEDEKFAARRALMQWGIRVDPGTDTVRIANRHVMLARIFAGGPYAGKWPLHLKRLTGATTCGDSTVRFGSVSSKAVEIPSGLVG